jgi:glycosyltransferase involved in cell wall biosynthesis
MSVGSDPRVSLVLPVRNEESSIAECLEGMQNQTYRDMEILVIDGLSDDRTLAIVESRMADDPRIRIVLNHERVIPAALNLGLEEARGTYLIRFDAHSVAPPDYVARIVDHLESGSYAGVGGTKIAVGGTSAMSQVIAGALSSRFGVGGSSYHYAEEATCVDHIPFGAYPVDLLRSLGGWNPQLLANEDFEMDYRVTHAGGRLLLDPEIRILWKSSQTLRDFGRQYQRYGRGKAAVARLHPDSLKLRHLLPVVELLVFSGSVVASVILRRAWPLLANTPYACFLLASFSDAPLRRSSGRSPWLLPLVLTTMQMSWAVGFVRAIWRRRSGGRVNDPYRWRDLSQEMPAAD